MSTGFRRKAVTPRRWPGFAVADTTTTGTRANCGSARRTARNSQPFITGIIMARRMMRGGALSDDGLTRPAHAKPPRRNLRLHQACVADHEATALRSHHQRLRRAGPAAARMVTLHQRRGTRSNASQVTSRTKCAMRTFAWSCWSRRAVRSPRIGFPPGTGRDCS